MTKSCISAGDTKESTKLCLCRVLLMDVLCTTSINRRLQEMYELSHFLDRAIETSVVGESYLISRLFCYIKDAGYEK